MRQTKTDTETQNERQTQDYTAEWNHGIIIYHLQFTIYNLAAKTHLAMISFLGEEGHTLTS